MINVTKVKALPGHVLRLTFSDGTSGDAPLHTKLESFRPLKPLLNEALFRQARVEDGTVVWPDGLDIAAEQLYALAHHLPEPASFDQAENNELVMSLQELRRMVSHVNQEEVAVALAVTQGAVSRLETGGSDTKLGTLRRYLNAIGWDLEVNAVQGDKRIRLRGV